MSFHEEYDSWEFKELARKLNRYQDQIDKLNLLLINIQNGTTFNTNRLGTAAGGGSGGGGGGGGGGSSSDFTGAQVSFLTTKAQSIKDKDLTAPPGSPADGDAYIPASVATGAWAGLEKHVVIYDSSAATWDAIAPLEGMLVYINDEDMIYWYSGAAWIKFVITESQISNLDHFVQGDITALPLTQLASGTSAQIIVANATGVPAYVTMSGDVTISNSGVTTVANESHTHLEANITDLQAYVLPNTSPTFATVTVTSLQVVTLDLTRQATDTLDLAGGGSNTQFQVTEDTAGQSALIAAYTGSVDARYIRLRAYVAGNPSIEASSTIFINQPISINGAISRPDSSGYIMNFTTATNWGIYWNTAINTIEFHSDGTKKAEIELNNGKTAIGGNFSARRALEVLNDIIIYDGTTPAPANSWLLHLDAANGLEFWFTTAIADSGWNKRMTLSEAGLLTLPQVTTSVYSGDENTQNYDPGATGDTLGERTVKRDGTFPGTANNSDHSFTLPIIEVNAYAANDLMLSIMQFFGVKVTVVESNLTANTTTSTLTIKWYYSINNGSSWVLGGTATILGGATAVTFDTTAATFDADTITDDVLIRFTIQSDGAVTGSYNLGVLYSTYTTILKTP